jgi:hypothetical protein
LTHLTLPTAAFSTLSHLCLYFWANECRPLPTTQDELRSNARVHQLTWERHRDRVLKAFEDIRPELERYFRLRESKGTTLRQLSDRGYAARTRKRLQGSAERQRVAGVILPTPKRTAANTAAAIEERQTRGVIQTQNEGNREIGFLD